MGSIKVNFDFAHGPHGLHSKLQTIAGQLDTINSTRQVSRLTQLTKTLDETSCALQAMKLKAHAVFGQSQINPFERLEEEIIDMYGRIEDALVNRKISQIREEADSIKQAVAQGAPADVKTVNALKRHIFLFLKDYRPKIKDRLVINDAKEALQEALTFKEKSPHEKVVPHFDWLSQQKNIRFIEEIELEPGQYEDLFDIAAMVYNGKFREAKSQFRQLPENLKRTIHQHLQELTAVAFDDEIETIQALLATANQLLNNKEPYPTRNQIDEIFLGLREVLNEEEKNPVIHELRMSQ